MCENIISGDSPGEQNKHLFWGISLVDNVHHSVSEMTDERSYDWVVITVESYECYRCG